MYMSSWHTHTLSWMCFSVSGRVDIAAEEYLRVYNAIKKLVALTRITIKDTSALSDLDNLQKMLEGSDDDHYDL